MSLRDETREALAEVIRFHRWKVSGGTASGAYWRCTCGAEGRARSGLREHADMDGAAHVADVISDAIDMALDHLTGGTP